MPPPLDLRTLVAGGTSIRLLRKAIRAALPSPLIVLVQGSPAFPPVCFHCEQPANQTLHIERAFPIEGEDESSDAQGNVPVFESFRVPICNSCHARNSPATIQTSPWLIVRRLMSESNGFAGLVVIAISGLFFKEALFNFKLVPLIMGLFPLGIGLWLIRPVWRNSRFMTIPPPTTMESSIEFSPSLALTHEHYWRAFVFRSESYAEKFRQANLQNLWDFKSTEAVTASKRRKAESNRNNWIIGTIVAIVLLWTLWSEVIEPFFGN